MDAITDKTTTPERPSRTDAEEAIRVLLAWLGEDPQRAGLADTPRRVVSVAKELLAGYDEDAQAILARSFKHDGTYDDLIAVKNIAFVSHCEHHMMPFVGIAHVAYWPHERIAGLSKVARLVHSYARRLQTQEALTTQIATTLGTVLQPRGVAVAIEAEHHCMSLRGVRQAGARTLTSHFSGICDTPAVRRRFLDLAGGKFS